MKFRETHPNYETYDDSEFYMFSIPTGLVSALKGFILRYADDSDKLKIVCGDLATRIPCEPTTNWGWDWLVNDFDDLFRRLGQSKFYKFMDFIGDFVHEYVDEEGIEELNDLFEEYEFGYRLADDPRGGLIWNTAVSVSKRIASVEAAKGELKDVCDIAIEHLHQALQHLKKPHDERARKDAIRDCMSAMESMLKSLSATSDIKDATTKLRSENRWGEDTIVKDGLSIWNRLHDLYPDIRHGQSTSSQLSDDEALYWIDRISAFVTYISRRKKQLS